MVTRKHNLLFFIIFFVVLIHLTSCGGGGGSSGQQNWQQGVYNPSAVFAGSCDFESEQLFIRSIFNEYYLWYQDSQDPDPTFFNSLTSYFYSLVSNEITPSGKLKDEFSGLVDTVQFNEFITSGIDIGYGIHYVIEENNLDQVIAITVGFVVSDSPADHAGVQRGDRITAINGINLPTSNNDIYRGLFPFNENETHTFRITNLNNLSATKTLSAAKVTIPATDNYQIITSDNDPSNNPDNLNVGYLQFNDHTEASEAQLINAFNNFKIANINNLIIDLRYNAGGYGYIANQVTYMIAGASNTANKIYGRLNFNDRFAPVTREFLTASSQELGSINLPTLDLNRVYIISGIDTCSASEGIINGLRGIDIEVILIGGITCGKPYGFFGHENCGITYLPVELQSTNNKDFGSYADGFKPANDNSNTFAVPVTGCAVDDDFTNPMGDVAEERLATALYYIQNNACPPQTVIQSSFQPQSLQIHSPYRYKSPRAMMTPAEIKKQYGVNLIR